MPEQPDRIEFHYLKSPQYRTIHVDGAWGGVTPRGNVAVSLYSERSPIPRRVDFQLQPDGSLKEVDREGRKGYVRELEVGLVFNEITARAFHDWLKLRLDEIEERREDSASR